MPTQHNTQCQDQNTQYKIEPCTLPPRQQLRASTPAYTCPQCQHQRQKSSWGKEGNQVQEEVK